MAAGGSDGPASSAARLRPAREGDGRTLFAWVNNPDSLAAKLRTRTAIAWEDHRRWLAARLADPDTGLWIAEVGGEPAGQVRLQAGAGGMEVDVYVAPSHRGRGLGLTLLGHAADEARRRWPGRPLLARVKPDNRASRRLFERAGYELSATAPDHLVYAYAASPGDA